MPRSQTSRTEDTPQVTPFWGRVNPYESAEGKRILSTWHRCGVRGGSDMCVVMVAGVLFLEASMREQQWPAHCSVWRTAGSAKGRVGAAAGPRLAGCPERRSAARASTCAGASTMGGTQRQRMSLADRCARRPGCGRGGPAPLGLRRWAEPALQPGAKGGREGGGAKPTQGRDPQTLPSKSRSAATKDSGVAATALRQTFQVAPGKAGQRVAAQAPEAKCVQSPTRPRSAVCAGRF
ncbi:MAG: hypothetical protein J3K34DRAFT_9305 [Monoraphidium minutum]|nr:MAG: hypothetical protein J3K34DRAFT_9305 [Monoraphidium minutum]